MTRQEIYSDMEETFGLVPSFFKIVPDSTLEQLDYEEFKDEVRRIGEYMTAKAETAEPETAEPETAAM